MTSKRTQIRVGIFSLAALGLGALVLITFGGLHLFSHSTHYAVELHDSVMGLETGASVYFNGIEVGKVEHIAVAPEDLSQVRIELAVDENTPVRTDTVAFISMGGLTGIKTIDLHGGSMTAPPMPAGGTLKAGQGTLDKLEAKAQELVDESGKLIQQADQIVAGTRRVIANLERVTDPAPIAAITASTVEATRTLASASHGIEAMVAEDRVALHGALDSIGGASKSAQDLIQTQVASLVNNANDLVVDMRGVVQGNQTQMTAAMLDLRRASRSFEELAREVKDRPSRLLFSSTPKDRKLP